ncbi:MAG: HAD family phosphatase [Ilumatobacteraceae bacterium]
MTTSARHPHLVSTIESTIDTAIFDLGGVLMLNGRHRDLVRRFPPEHADAALRVFVGDYATDGDHPWHRLERGEITMGEFRTLSQSAFEAAGIPPLPTPPEPEAGEAPKPMIAFEPNEAMLDLVRRLREVGVRTGMLTNNVKEFRDAWRGLMPWHELFDDIVDSHEVGLRKPNPAIYHLAATRLKTDPSRAVFLDDVASNVEAARSIGMTGVVVDEDSAPAIAEVNRLFGLTGA